MLTASNASKFHRKKVPQIHQCGKLASKTKGYLIMSKSDKHGKDKMHTAGSATNHITNMTTH